MADNTVLNPTSGGDTVRDLARQSGSIKTQVVQLDLGGASANAESLITAGAQTPAASVPVVLANALTSFSLSSVGATQSLTNPSYGTLGIQVTSIGVDGSLAFEGSNDNSNWAALFGLGSNVGSSAAGPATMARSPGAWWLSIEGVAYVRVRVVTLSSGSIVGAMFPTSGSMITALAGGVGPELSVNSWPVVLASDQPVIQMSDTYTRVAAMLTYQQLLVQMGQPTAGFVPLEIPSFLIGM